MSDEFQPPVYKAVVGQERVYDNLSTGWEKSDSKAGTIFVSITELLQADSSTESDAEVNKEINEILADEQRTSQALGFLAVKMVGDSETEKIQGLRDYLSSPNVKKTEVAQIAAAIKRIADKFGGEVAAKLVNGDSADVLAEAFERALGKSMMLGGEGGATYGTPGMLLPQLKEVGDQLWELMNIEYEGVGYEQRKEDVNDAVVLCLNMGQKTGLGPHFAQAIIDKAKAGFNVAPLTMLLPDAWTKYLKIGAGIKAAQSGKSEEVGRLAVGLSGKETAATLNVSHVDLRVVLESGREIEMRVDLADIIDWLKGDIGPDSVIKCGELRGRYWNRLLSLYGEKFKELFPGVNFRKTKDKFKRFGVDETKYSAGELLFVKKVLNARTYQSERDYQVVGIHGNPLNNIQSGEILLPGMFTDGVQMDMMEDPTIRASYKPNHDPLAYKRLAEAEQLTTMTDLERFRDGADGFVDWLMEKYGFSKHEVARVESIRGRMFLTREDKKTHEPILVFEIGLAADGEVADIADHPAYKDGASPREHLIYEVITSRLSGLFEMAETYLNVAQEMHESDPAMRKTEVPDALVYIHQGSEYFERYRAFVPDIRKLFTSMYSGLRYRNKGFTPIKQAVGGMRRVMSSLNPFDHPSLRGKRLGAIELGVDGRYNKGDLRRNHLKDVVIVSLGENDVRFHYGKGGSEDFIKKEHVNGRQIERFGLEKLQGLVIDEMYFAQRRIRSRQHEDVKVLNKLKILIESGVAEEVVDQVAEAEFWRRILDRNTFSSSGRCKSSSEVLAILQKMGQNGRQILRYIDHTENLASYGEDIDSLSLFERFGWGGARIAAEYNTKSKHFNYDANYNFNERQWRYGGAAGDMFVALGALATETIQAMDPRDLETMGLRISGSFKPDDAMESAWQSIISFAAPRLQRNQLVADYFNNLMKGVRGVSDLAKWMSSGDKAQLMKDMVVFLATAIEPTVREVVYVISKDSGLPLEEMRENYSGVVGESRTEMVLSSAEGDNKKAVLNKNQSQLLASEVKGYGLGRIIFPHEDSGVDVAKTLPYVTSPDSIPAYIAKAALGENGQVVFDNERISMYESFGQMNIHVNASIKTAVRVLTMSLRDAGVITKADEKQVIKRIEALFKTQETTSKKPQRGLFARLRRAA